MEEETDFALKITEVLLEKGIIRKFASNIKVLDSKGYDYTHITNLVALNKWLYPKRIHKLYILDEAGVNVDRRNPLGKVSRQIRHLGFLLRRFRGKLIFISQRWSLGIWIELKYVCTSIALASF